MLPLLLIVLAQTQPAVKRTTPASDDPGMVVRQVGTVNVNCTSGCSGSGGGWTPDGGYIGSVTAIVEFDGGLVTANQGTPASTANRWPVQLTDGTDLSLVSAAGALLVDGSGVTQPISAASLPLPTGASTSALQTTEHEPEQHRHEDAIARADHDGGQLARRHREQPVGRPRRF